jgi:tripartite-type tricarboxylate transporter receptor subunit TctC
MRLLRTLLLVLLALYAASPLSQPYPNRPIKLVVPFPPGGSIDFAARVIQAKLAEHLGQPVVIENKGGAGGIIGAEYVARQPNDGYTLLLAGSGILTMYPVFHAKLRYDPLRDFTPVAVVTSTPLMAAAHPSVPANTLKEFIAYAKANPGKVAAGAPNPGSILHLSLEMFKSQADIDLLIVTYKAGAPAVSDVLGNQIQFIFELPATLMPHLKAGRLKPLAVTGGTRLPTLPDTPTFAEEGFEGFDSRLWAGVVAPAGTPAAIVDKISQSIAKALDEADVRAKFASHEVEPSYATPREFAARIQAETQRWREVARTINLKLE